ncbi:hypothetical protein CKAH01_16660 [Colletotrichum kahawae]|uniref:Nephrocystin 3-like N-terminal domain-containing protein n=1 Tax=Colletotrichum kahawae TaxID=34407 RepID=A0AAE0D539_COLKA|nr:hypothetical protein CKAH01_16660 [Colletotrichum kahawae]
MEEEHPNPQILSHFIWKPGRPMQRSLKGVLCSLLYQVLEADKQSCIKSLARFPRLRYKGSDTDWTCEELKSVLLSLLRNTSRRYLILLDGLDEMTFSVDGETPLIRLLDELLTTQPVKISIDFLVDDEDGRKILEGHALKSDELFSKQVKTILLTASFFKPEHRMATQKLNMPHSQFFTGQLFTRLFLHKEDSISAVTLHSLLSLVHRHADAIIRHRQKHFKNSQQQFLAIATYFGFSDWATEFLESMEQSDGEMQLFVLRAACAPFNIDFPYGDCFWSDEENLLPRRLGRYECQFLEIATQQDSKRETLIREILTRGSQSTSQAEAQSFQNSGSQHNTALGSIFNAWRCFLVHKLQGIADGHFLHISNTVWAEKMETLRSFLSGSISSHFRRQKYSVCVLFSIARSLQRRAVVSLHFPWRLPQAECSVYLEVNDDFLLSSILDNMSKRGVEGLPLASKDLQPSVKAVMFRTRTHSCDPDLPSRTTDRPRFFEKAVNVGPGDSEELFEEIMFQVPGQDFPIYRRLVAQAEFVLDGAKDHVDGLKAAGYELSEVDTNYECLHEEILW